MKKIVVLLCAAILSFASLFALTGCNNSILVDGSFKYSMSWSSYQLDLIGSFTVIDKSGDANGINYTLKGYDKAGNELWSEDYQCDLDNGGIIIHEDNYTVLFQTRISTSNAPSYQNTVYVILANVKFEKESSNEWMGWTFGFVSLALTGGVIALFVISKIKEAGKKKITEQNSEEN